MEDIKRNIETFEIYLSRSTNEVEKNNISKILQQLNDDLKSYTTQTKKPDANVELTKTQSIVFGIKTAIIGMLPMLLGILIILGKQQKCNEFNYSICLNKDDISGGLLGIFFVSSGLYLLSSIFRGRRSQHQISLRSPKLYWHARPATIVFLIVVLLSDIFLLTCLFRLQNII